MVLQGFQRLLSKLRNRADFQTSLRVEGTGEIQTQAFYLTPTENTVLWYGGRKREQSLRIVINSTGEKNMMLQERLIGEIQPIL